MNFAMLLPIIYSVLSSLGLGSINIPFLIVLVIIGLIIIILIKLFLVLIPAIIVAAIVYFLTGGPVLDWHCLPSSCTLIDTIQNLKTAKHPNILLFLTTLADKRLLIT